MKGNDRQIVPIIIALSVVVPLAVAALILFPDVFNLNLGIERGTLPAFHAFINGTTAVLLVVGLVFIRSKNMVAHRASMLFAFGLSAVFLLSYVISKLNADPIPYQGDFRGLYLFVLISHILLSIPVLPLAMFAIYRGWTNNIEKHKKVVRLAFPVWLYVAITGVLVYIFMAPYY